MKFLLFLVVYVGVAAANCNEKLKYSENEFQYSDIDLKGSCPKIKYITNFRMDRIVGWHYQAYSSIKNSLCFRNQGHTLYGARYDDKSLSVQLCCRSASNPRMTYCGSKVGSGFVTATNTTGKYLYQTGNEYNNLPVFILDTNYDDYIICYGCRPAPCEDGKHTELIYILSRDYALSDTSRARVRNILELNGIKFSDVNPVL